MYTTAAAPRAALPRDNTPDFEKILTMDEYDPASIHVRFIRRSIEIARRARDHGNHPFGALLVDGNGQILLEAENTVVTDNDATGHAETNLIRMASKEHSPELLATCTLYTSTEPCAMCAGAIFWGNVRRVVYGLSEAELYALVADDAEDVLHYPCRDLFAQGRKSITVIGPVLEELAKTVHAGFWTEETTK